MITDRNEKNKCLFCDKKATTTYEVTKDEYEVDVCPECEAWLAVNSSLLDRHLKKINL